MNDALLTALSTVVDPELRRPITDLGMVSHADLTDGIATVGIRLTIQGCPLKDTIQQDIREALTRLEGVQDVHIDLDYMTPEQRRSLRDRLGHTKTNPFASPDNLTQVYAVASGKGGVGKSTVTANLAAALASEGLSVGIVDADVHGFSIPGLLGVTQPPTKLEDMILPPVVEVPEQRRLQPEGRPAGSIRVISIGMFVEGNKPIAWRGPMLHRALEQFLTDVHFGDLDVLLLDLPPGTGDVAISMSQLVPSASLLVVSTPQAAAVDVAERAGTMSLQTGQKVLGVVENMSAMVMPDGSRVDLFGEGGGQTLSERLTRALNAEVPLLGSVPLDMALRRGGDAGTPVVWSDPESPSGAALRAIAENIREDRRGLSGKSLPLNLS